MITGNKKPSVVETIASGVGSVAKLAGAILPIIASINTEVKYYDTSASVTAYNPGTNDQIIALSSGLAVGTGDTARIGASILAKDIQIRMYHTFGADATHWYNIGRITILCWKDNANANPPTIAKIYQVPADLNSTFNKDYTDQFVVLKDKFYVENVQFNPGVAAGMQVQKFKFYKKLDHHMRWVGSTTNGTQGHLYMILRGGWGAAANGTFYNYYARMNYTDD